MTSDLQRQFAQRRHADASRNANVAISAECVPAQTFVRRVSTIVRTHVPQ